MVGVLEELFEDRWDFSSRWMSEAFASIEVLMVVLCAVSANEKECLWYFWSQARCKEKWLKEVVGIPFPNGIPSYDKIRRVLGMLDPTKFQASIHKIYGTYAKYSRE